MASHRKLLGSMALAPPGRRRLYDALGARPRTHKAHLTRLAPKIRSTSRGSKPSA